MSEECCCKLSFLLYWGKESGICAWTTAFGDLCLLFLSCAYVIISRFDMKLITRMWYINFAVMPVSLSFALLTISPWTVVKTVGLLLQWLWTVPPASDRGPFKKFCSSACVTAYKQVCDQTSEGSILVEITYENVTKVLSSNY